jgi:hypothetical protein
MFDVLFLSVVCFLVSGHHLGAAIYDNLQNLEEQDFEQLGERDKCP